MAEPSRPPRTDETSSGPPEPEPLPPPSPPATLSPLEDRRTSPVELLWDLVFVFAVTQVTTLLTDGPGWARFGEAMLCLALIWWAWSAFVWAANAQAEDSGPLRACLLVATVLIFICGLALPQAFAAEGLLFAGSYTVVRLLHLAVYVDASRRGNASLAAIMGFAVTVLTGMALLIVGGAALHGWARALVWTAAAAIDYAGPAWLTRERLRGLQRVAVDHFAERYGLFLLICLGESVVALGAGVGGAHRHIDAALILRAGLALLIAGGLWWTYFDRLADAASHRLRGHADPVLAAADGYSYLHLVIVAGVITYAGGVKLLVHPSAGGLTTAGRLALCGGVALYMAGVAAFGLRLTGRLDPGRPLLALALLVVFAAGAGLSATLLIAIICALTLGLCAVETISERRSISEPRSAAEA
ncbi:MAG TPA: low temperature requirement protein A [Solirubrobacteraceae bacterium]|nr:low temperature requirement protein A [Solirubrobacteraceae bacterium]